MYSQSERMHRPASKGSTVLPDWLDDIARSCTDQERQSLRVNEMYNCDTCKDNTEINCHDCEQMQQRIVELCADGTRWGLSKEEDAELQRLVAKEKEHA